MECTDTNLREEYARYFFTVFEACLHDDEIGRRQAQDQLEEALARVVPAAVV